MSEKKEKYDYLDDDARFELESFEGTAALKAISLPIALLVVQVFLIVFIALLLGNRHVEQEMPDMASESLPQPVVSPPKEKEIIVAALADSMVNESRSRVLHGQTAVLDINQEQWNNRYALIKFKPPLLTQEEMEGASLRLFPAEEWGAKSPALKVLQCNNSWSEQEVHWGNYPRDGALSGYLPAGAGQGSDPVAIALNMFSFKPGEEISLFIAPGEPGGSAKLASREVPGREPVLIIRLR